MFLPQSNLCVCAFYDFVGRGHLPKLLASSLFTLALLAYRRSRSWTRLVSSRLVCWNFFLT